MYKDSKRTCTAIGFLIKPFVWRSSPRWLRRRGLLKVPMVLWEKGDLVSGWFPKENF